MSIEKQRHTETASDGKHIYVIEMPNRCNDEKHDHPNYNLDREMFLVKFRNGIGRTVSRIKAQRFDEWYGYKIYLHKEAKPWTNATNRGAVNDYIEDEPDVDLDTEELEDD